MPRMLISIDGVVIQEVDLVKQRTTLGRRPYNDIVIDNLAISGEHAALHMDLHSHVVEVEDLRSTNGVTVNGEPVVRHELKNGDVMEVGRYKIRFYTEPAEPFAATMFYQPPRPLAQAAQPDAPGDESPAPVPAANSNHGAAAAADLAVQEVAHSAAPVLASQSASPGPVAPASAAAAGAAAAASTQLAPTQVGVPASSPGNARIRIVSGEASGREVLLNKVVTTFGKPGVAVASITHRRNAFVLSHIEGAQPPILNGISIGDKTVPLQNGDVWVVAGTQMQFVM